MYSRLQCYNYVDNWVYIVDVQYIPYQIIIVWKCSNWVRTPHFLFSEYCVIVSVLTVVFLFLSPLQKVTITLGITADERLCIAVENEKHRPEKLYWRMCRGSFILYHICSGRLIYTIIQVKLYPNLRHVFILF